jgi:hypothetical protein
MSLQDVLSLLQEAHHVAPGLGVLMLPVPAQMLLKQCDADVPGHPQPKVEVHSIVQVFPKNFGQI